VASRETGLELNADKTKYMVISPDQNAKQSHSIKNDSFEKDGRVQIFGKKFNKSKFYSGRN